MALKRPTRWSPAGSSDAATASPRAAGAGPGTAPSVPHGVGDQQRAHVQARREVEVALDADGIGRMALAELGDVLRAHGPLAGAPRQAEADRGPGGDGAQFAEPSVGRGVAGQGAPPTRLWRKNSAGPWR
ncbi:hypothetical protein LDC_0082 [sediment metagenome]|uniref:Uncharacterized protein n=1 Tax=sediment metagenome TaxID=749907 RepID=D9PF04_9ZZZZ